MLPRVRDDEKAAAAEPKGNNLLQEAMRDKRLGAAELCRRVNHRLGFSALNRAAIWRLIKRGQVPKEHVQTAICEVLGRSKDDLFPRRRPESFKVEHVGPTHVRLTGDVRLPRDKVDELLALVASARRQRRSAWGALLAGRAGDLRLSGNALARRISSELPNTLQDSLNMQVSRYLRGLSYPATEAMRDAILRALEIEKESVPPSLDHPFSVRWARKGGEPRVQFDLVVGADLGDQLVLFLRENASGIRHRRLTACM